MAFGPIGVGGVGDPIGGGGTGSGNPGAWLSGASDPTDGASGTGAGTAPIGAFYTNTTTGVTFINQGSLAEPAWKGVINT